MTAEQKSAHARDAAGAESSPARYAPEAVTSARLPFRAKRSSLSKTAPNGDRGEVNGRTRPRFKDLALWHGEPDEPISLRLSHVVPGALVAALATVGAIATITKSAGGLYWFAVAVAVAVAIMSGHMNRGVLLVEIKR